MINLPTLRQLQYLLNLFETKNFSKAAQLSHVTQPTLSQAIQEMETLLGTKVLDRTKRKVVTFTPFGLDVIATTQKIMPELDAMIDSARQMQEPLSGVMQIGIIPTIAPYLLPQLLTPLQKHFPKMNFQFTEETSDNLIEKLTAGKIDIALMALPFEIKSLNHVILFEEEFICASPRNTFNKSQRLSIHDLDDKKLLLLQDGHCLRDHILSACSKVDNDSDQPLRATSLQTLIQMVGQGYGLTLLPEMMIKQGVTPKTVDLHYFGKPAPSRNISLVWRDRSYKKTNIKAVIKTLKKTL